jgi:hypothetical protein
MGFDFSIEYKMGRENIVADALSRRDETVSKEEQKSAELVALSSPTPNWVEVIKEEVDNDKDLQELIQRVKDGEALGPWQHREGVLFYKDRIYLSENSSLISAILEQIHGGFHEGYHKTFQRIRANFYWKGMRSRIKTFIRECEVCHKVEVTTPKGLLHPLPIPVQIWEDLLMDFIDGLPSSRGKSTIFVIVDRLSKYAHFLAISHPYTAISVAQVFFDNIFKLHGMPSLLCAIETQLLQANSGRNSLIYRARVLISAQHITPKRMAKRKW